jgi:UDP-glucose 4-epimerase
MSKYILVTGGSGYIGSHTVIELLQAGYTPVILDNFSNSSSEIIQVLEEISGQKIICIEGDCRNSAIYDTIFTKYVIQGVIHFAADKAVGESVIDPLKYFDNNINGLITLLKAMEKYDINTLVFSSSCTVYGSPKSPYVTEETELQYPESPYGYTKLVGEQMLNNLVTHKKQMKVALLRYFNPIGAHPSGKIGEFPQGIPNNLLPYITQTAIGVRKELSVFGNDYTTKDGTCIRDFIHVSDVANAHVHALNYLDTLETPHIEAINIGTGKGTSVLEIISVFEKEIGEKLNWKFAPKRPGDIQEIYAKVEKASTLLKWKANYSVADAIKHAWQWEKNLQAKS